MKLFESVVIAALLHDIGKFYQKGQQVTLIDNAGQHPAVSEKFILSYNVHIGLDTKFQN